MEMCYDSALVMPKNYALIASDEMEYVDGGLYKSVDHYFSSGYEASNWCSSLAGRAWGAYYCGWIGIAGLGALAGSIVPGIGNAVGALIGGVAGVIAGNSLTDVVAYWARELDRAATDAYNKGNRSCTVNTTLSGLSFFVSVY